MIPALPLTFAAFFLLGTFLMQVASSGFRALEQVMSLEQLKETESFSSYRHLTQMLFGPRQLEVLFFSISLGKHLYRFAFAVAATLVVWTGWIVLDKPLGAIAASVILVVLTLGVGDFTPRYFALKFPSKMLKGCGPLASLFLLVISPISWLIVFLTPKVFPSFYVEPMAHPVASVKEKILEMIQQAEASSGMDESEKELLESAAGLRDTLVREVMVPRVDMVCMPGLTKCREAADLFQEEGYSRIPIYKDNVDQITGLVLYKDVAGLYLTCDKAGDYSSLDAPVETLVKPVLYVPETSRVSTLLQEFRRKQTHLAIVVDEYGGTEGIVTIEDCLEEIVGEISDEFDEEEEVLYSAYDEGWIVDARMTIHDIEEQFGITIPSEGEYDTIGGYAFHSAGEIPPKGLRIYHDRFELEILESSDRCVEKVYLKPVNGPS